MSIYAGEGYTLLRVLTKDGLAISVSHRGAVRAAVRARDIGRTAEALRFAREHVRLRRPTVDVVAGLTVRVLDGTDTMRVHVDDRSKPIAKLDADYLELVGRLLKADPSATYYPFRRVAVRTGDVIIHHHEKQRRSTQLDRDAAFNTLRAYLGDRAVVCLLTEGEPES